MEMQPTPNFMAVEKIDSNDVLRGAQSQRDHRHGWLVRAVVRSTRRVARHMRARRDYERLLHAPDRILKDIGLTRDDVHAAMMRHRF